MARHRELVNPSDFLYFIPQLPKHLHISCQRCGIAGYIHDAVRLHAGHGVEEVFFAAFSRRIDDDDVRVGVFARVVFGVLFVVGRKNLFRFSNEKFSVFDLVDFRIVLRIRNCLRDDFDAVDFFGFLREEQGNRSDAAVEIPDRLISGETCIFQGKTVQLFRLRRVDLVEGQRGDPIFYGSNIVCDIPLSLQAADFFSHDHIGPLTVYA